MQMSGASIDWLGTLDGPVCVHGSTVALSHLPTPGDTLAGEQWREPFVRQETVQLLKL